MTPFFTIGDEMTQVRLELGDYSLRVIDVVKGKHGLKNRSDALKLFVREQGLQYMQPEIKLPDAELAEVDEIIADAKENGAVKMSLSELKNHMGL